MPDHIFGNGCLRDIDSKLKQFAVNSRGSPEGIISAHGADEFANILRNAWSSRLAMLTFPGPEQAESLAVPRYNCLGFDNDESRSPLRPSAKEPDPE